MHQRLRTFGSDEIVQFIAHNIHTVKIDPLPLQLSVSRRNAVYPRDFPSERDEMFCYGPPQKSVCPGDY